AVGNDKVVRAFDATDVTKTPLWTSAQNSARDGLPSVGHFQFPTAVNGKVYVPTGSASIAVYGLLPSAPPSNVVTQVRYFPRAGFASRMVGGKFQGSLDGTTYTDLATITQTPTAGQYTALPISTTTAYRYLRYLAPTGGYGNIAELEFDSGTGSGLKKLAGTPFGTPGSWQNHGNDFTKVFDANTSTFFDAPDPGNADYAGIDLGAATAVYQIDAGGGASSPFAADSHVQGGSTYIASAAVSTTGVVNPAPQAVYQSERYGNFTYTLSGLTPGASYTLRLHFAEIYWTRAGVRVFNVSVNSRPVLSNFDIFAAAGGANKAIVKTYPAVADANGHVTVGFTTVKDNAKLSGLELLH
ncbi:MAG: malectin, partial [Armatimonadota bacterium]|nr:malectin [Armatimonadota bacterium]